MGGEEELGEGGWVDGRGGRRSGVERERKGWEEEGGGVKGMEGVGRWREEGRKW